MSNPKSFNFVLTEDGVNVILNALGKQPFNEVYGLIFGIRDQFNAQVTVANAVGNTSVAAETQEPKGT